MTPNRQLADDSEDNSNSSIDSNSSISVEAAPKALNWRNDTSSSTSGRKVSCFRNVSTIHSVSKSKRLTEKKDNSKAEAKSPTGPEAAAPGGERLPDRLYLR